MSLPARSTLSGMHGTAGPTMVSLEPLSSTTLVDDACAAYDKPVLNDLDNGGFSERFEAGGLAQQSADEFALAADDDIRGVSWSGSYYQTDLPATTTEVDFRIRFFDDVGGKPGNMPVHDELVTAQATNSGVVLNNRVVYLFEADFASTVALNGGVTYWISVLEEDAATPYFSLAWRWSNSATGFGDTYALRNIDGSGWTLWGGARANKAFQLQVCEGEAEVLAVAVGIDIKPGSDRNPVNLRSRGRIPVAILTTDGFDAGDVDPSTVTLGNDDGNDTPVAGRRNGLMASLEDVDDDGDLDLVMHFDTQALVANGDLDANTTELILNGVTTGGEVIHGSDTATIVPR